MSSNTEPLVSIIVPVYNAEAYLGQCINSLINQTYRNIEIILINDGSTDSSGSICDRLAADDNRIQIHHIKNGGVSNARNLGISKARGVYIMFLDSDDWIEPETCGVAVKEAKEINADIVFWSWIKETQKGSFKETYLERNSDILIKNDIDRLRIRSVGLLDNELSFPVKTDAFNTPWAKLYKKEFINRAGVEFVERKKVGMEDVLFNIQLFQKVNSVTYIPKYFNHYRLDNPNSLTKVDTLLLHNKFKSLFAAISSIDLKESRFKESLNNRISTSVINIMLSLTNPRILYSFKERISITKDLLKDELFCNALSKFDLSYLPVHWKVFFFLAKNKKPILLLSLTYIIRILK